MDMEGMPELLDQLKECPEFFRKAYLNSDNLSQATLKVVNQLFGAQGLVSIDADNAHLKRLFIPVMKDDLLNQTAFNCVMDATEALADQGYKTLVTPREINLFYLKDNSRNRIVQKNQSYEVLDGNLSFSKEEILEQLDLHPVFLSPYLVLSQEIMSW